MNQRDLLLVAVVISAGFISASPAAAQTETNLPRRVSAHNGGEFTHPGMLHSREDLEFIRKKVVSGEEPWKSAWTKLRNEPVSALSWKPAPVPEVTRGPYNHPDIGSSAMMRDSAAAYSQALQWYATGDKAHAHKAIEILDAWSATLNSIKGQDKKLLAGITAYKFCNAAEILRCSASDWSAASSNRFRTMLLAVYYPLLKDFAPNNNGGNWHAAIVNSLLCIGVFCDDHAIFDRAIEYYRHGAGHGSLTHYIYPSGQCQESTRDQQHTQLGLGMLAAACEVAWKQAVDLYGESDNRLLLGYEYTAKYNLGYDVPCKGQISPKDRGEFRPIYEKVYQHYACDQGLEMPYTKAVLAKIRPEGWHPDHESWGTLTCYKGSRSSTDAGPR